MADIPQVVATDKEPVVFNEHGVFDEHSIASEVESTSALIATYDFQQLIEKFISEVRTSFPCDGIEYREDSINLHLIDGRMSRHRCCYQLTVDDSSLGELVFTRHNAFTEAETTTLDVMVAGLVYPLRHAIRYQNAIRIAQRDSLTGLRNSNYYHDMIELEILRAKRYSTTFSILIIDLDDFELLNSSYGSKAGDEVLAEMAERIEVAARECDMVFRYGGDEFLVMLPNTGEVGAFSAAERMKERSLNLPIYCKGKNVCLTFSVGMATVRHEDNVFTLFERGAKALYHAKILGKNRIRKIEEDCMVATGIGLSAGVALS